jgi:hypothetical protein
VNQTQDQEFTVDVTGHNPTEITFKLNLNDPELESNSEMNLLHLELTQPQLFISAENFKPIETVAGEQSLVLLANIPP